MRFSLVPFEERILLDAAGAANVANAYEAEHSADQAQQQAQAQQQHADNPGAVSGNNDAVDGRILVISSQVNDSALLAGAAKDGVTVITYDFNTSLADLADTIADKLGGKEASSIGFAMLGTEGKFSITNDTLMMVQGLESNIDHQAFWAEMGSLVKNGGSIDILACDVGINTEGLQLINDIDNFVDSTNHLISVNASTDATGNLSSGGNWDLEVGNVSALDRYFDTDKVIHWDGLLDPITVKDITVTVKPDVYTTIHIRAYQNGAVVTELSGQKLFIKAVGGDYEHVPGNYSSSGDWTFYSSTSLGSSVVIKYEVTANNGKTFIDSGLLTINIDNTAPVAQAAAFTTAEDIAYNGVAKATDVNTTQKLTYSIASQPAHGTVTIDATTGVYKYKNTRDYNGPDSFTFKVSDGALTSTAKISVNVTPVNDAPVINGEDGSVLESARRETPENTPLTSKIPLAKDVDSTKLIYSLVTNYTSRDVFVLADCNWVFDDIHTTHGKIVVNPNGTFTYTPALNYTGNDYFMYRVSDGALTSKIGVMQIYVSPVDDAPVAASSSAKTLEDTPISGLVKATDSDSSTLTYSLVKGPSYGSLVFKTNGTYTYTPSANYSGADSFTYKASDGSSFSNIAAVSLTVTPVNDAPTGTVKSYSDPEDTTLTVTKANGLLVGSNDRDGDLMTIQKVSNPSNGTLQLNTDGSFVYTPNLNFNGPDTFTYKISDGKGGLSPLMTATINIGAVNDAPVAASTTLVTPEDTSFAGTLQATDADSDPLIFTIVSTPQNGVVSVQPDGSYIYTPNNGYAGSDSFSFIANDGTIDSAPATVNITVGGVNDAPNATAATVTVTEDTPFNGTLSGTDVDGDILTYLIQTPPQHGTILLDPNTGDYTYTPAANFNGADSFSFQASDGSLTSAATTVTLNVTPVDDAPVSAGDTLTTSEDTPVGGSHQGTDVDSLTLTYTIVTQPANGSVNLDTSGNYVYTPNPNFNGIDSFTYTANDGTSDSNISTVNINVTSVNDAPEVYPSTISTPEDTPYNGQVVWIDPDNTNFNVTVGQQPQNGSVVMNSDGSYTYTPKHDYTGPDSFSVVVNDGDADSDSQTISINVGPVDDAPVVISPTLVTAEDTSLYILPATAGYDVDSPTFSINVVTPPTNGEISVNTDDGSVTYKPNADFNGTDTFRYILFDGTTDSADVGTVTINVIPVNDAPIASSPTLATAEDSALSIPVADLGTDIDGDPLDVLIDIHPQHGTATINNDGSIEYNPEANYNGPDSFTYRIFDGSTVSADGVVNLFVTPINDAPIPKSPTLGMSEDSSLTVSPTDLGTDVDGDPLTITIKTPPANGILIQNTDGSVTYTPTQDYNGNDSFSYTVNDGTTDSVIGTVKLVIVPVNDAPVVTEPTVNVSKDSQVIIPISDLGSDVDADTLTVFINNPPDNGTVDVNDNGTVTYTPNQNYHGPDSFTYTVNDGQLDSQPGVVNIVVTPSDNVIEPPPPPPPPSEGPAPDPVDNPIPPVDYIAPPTHTTEHVGQTNGGPIELDPLTFDNSVQDRGFNNHTYRILSTDIIDKNLNLIEDLKFENGADFQEDGGNRAHNDGSVGDIIAGDSGLSIKPIVENDFSNAGERWYYQNEDLTKLLFVLGPIVDNVEYNNKKHLKNLQKNTTANLFLYRERKKVKKFSELLEMLALLDLSFKRKSKAAIQNESLKTVQRSSLEKNLNPDEYGEEFLNKYVQELNTLSDMEVEPEQFPALEALAVEILTKYIIAQDLELGFRFRFPVFRLKKRQSAVEYHLERIFPLGTSEIPVYLFTAKEASPILAFRGTKLGFKKFAEAQSVIENLNSEGPARAHYNDFTPVLKAFFNEWFSENEKSKKFRIFGYSQGGVLGQRAVVEFAQYMNTDEKSPSIFFNSPGVEGVFFKAWNEMDSNVRPAVVNYVTTGDIVSKTGVGFIGNIFEISPEKKRDLFASHFGVKFLEKDWKLYMVDPEGETKSKTRAILNAIQASFLTNEVYKIASAGIERLFADYDHNFSASKAIKTIQTNVVIPSATQPPPSRYIPTLQNSLLGSDAAMNTHVLSGHVSYINVNDNGLDCTKDSMIANQLNVIPAHMTKKSIEKLFETVTKSATKLSDAPDLTSFDYKRDQIIKKPTINRTSEPLDLTFEPDLYSQADMSAAAIAVMEDIREFLPDAEDGTGNAVLDAVKEEKNIDHLNR